MLRRVSLNPDHLLTFTRVAALGSLSAAATELNLTQPAVSAQMKLLTQAVGEPLLIRHRHGVTLTPAGAGLLPHARTLTRSLHAAQDYLNELRGLDSGTLNVAASSTIAAAILPGVLAAFHAAHPRVTIQVRQGNTREVLAALQAAQAEVALIEGPPGAPGPDWTVTPFGEDELILVAPPGTPAGTPPDLIRLPLIWRERGSGTREVAEAALARAGLNPPTLLELPGTEAVKEAVIQGLGAAFLPELRVRRELRAGLLVRLPLTLPGLRRPLTRVTPHPEGQSRAARAFLTLLEQRP